jgi:SAM-dependent methyltransferase
VVDTPKVDDRDVGGLFQRILSGRRLNRPGRALRLLLTLIDTPVRKLSYGVPIPSADLLYEGPRSALLYRLNGWEYATILKRLGILRPYSRVLDIGCGVARKAHAIIPVVNERGSYSGLDIRKDAVGWCQAHWATASSEFLWLDIKNPYYAPSNRDDASSVSLPPASGGFDLILVCAVFMHMQGTAVAAYLRELARMLASDGSAFISLYLIDEFNADNIRNGMAAYRFIYEGDGCKYEDSRCPEHVVAHYLQTFEKACADAGLAFSGLYRGSWRGSRPDASYHDLVILRHARKPSIAC